MAHSEHVLERFRHPKYVQNSESLCVGRAGSKLAGSLIELHIAVEHDVLQARFRAYGCPATIASADFLAEQLDGSTLHAARPDRHDIIRALQLGPARQHCAALAIEAMDKALEALPST